MRKNNLKKLFNGLKNGDFDVINDNYEMYDAFIDLFYKAMNETTKEEAHEIIYTLINALLYGNDWEDICEDLKDSYILDDDFE